MNGEYSEALLQPAAEYKAQYERVKELGRGKFGIVYEVKEKSGGGGQFAAKYVRYVSIC